MFDRVLNTLLMNKHFVGNRAKGQIAKQWLQENKAHQIFRKKNKLFLPPDMLKYGCVSWDLSESFGYLDYKLILQIEYHRTKLMEEISPNPEYLVANT